MEIVSGHIGRTVTHYLAPPHDKLNLQLQALIDWFNKTADDIQYDGIIRAAVLHLWFEILHPYDDGNGRIGRALVELALAQDEQTISLKTKFWQLFHDTVFTKRQIKILNKLLDKGRDGFEGGLSTRKYVTLTKASQVTAYRELSDLVTKQYLRPLPTQGRNSAYEINWLMLDS
jgi:Fic family protein